MKSTFRTILFWMHLVSGLVAGIIIGIMSLTGAALAFEPQLDAVGGSRGPAGAASLARMRLGCPWTSCWPGCVRPRPRRSPRE